MKKIILIIGVLSTFFAKAQDKDSVSLGAGYAKQVYYSLQNGEQKSVDLNAWDLAFGTGAQGSSIRFNGATGNVLYTYPNGDISSWETVDTVGIKSWKSIYDSDTAWELTAFNKVTNDDFDLGWGVYSMITHIVSGDSVYVAKIGNSYKKFYIDRLQGATYYLVHANLDGSDELTTSIKKADFTGKNFGYFSFTSNQVLDLEPAANSWDLLFTKYLTEIPGYGSYAVTGVLSNIGVKTALVSDGSTIKEINADDFEFDFSSQINFIGYDWKTYVFANNSYAIEDSSIYVIQDVSGKNWNFELLDFGGSANGKVVFQVLDQSIVGLFDSKETNVSVQLYPNPVETGAELFLEIPDNGVADSISLIDQKGTTVWQGSGEIAQIPTQNLESGVYILSLITSQNTYTARLIVK